MRQAYREDIHSFDHQQVHALAHKQWAGSRRTAALCCWQNSNTLQPPATNLNRHHVGEPVCTHSTALMAVIILGRTQAIGSYLGQTF